MPRGNPNFGREVRSPGRPRKIEANEDAKTYREGVIKEHLDDLLHVLLEDAITRRNPKSAKDLIEMLLGRPSEPSTDNPDQLAAILRMLAQRRPPVGFIEGEAKEISPDTEPSPDDEPSEPDRGPSD